MVIGRGKVIHRSVPYVAMTFNNLANLYHVTQRMKEAETAHQEALSIRRELANANPETYPMLQRR